MGLRDHGDDPVTLAQTGSPCARVHESDQDFSTFCVPGGASIETQFNPVGLRASDQSGAVSSIGGPGGASTKRLGAAR